MQDRPDLVSETVARTIASWNAHWEITVAEIDSTLADTKGFCERYKWALEDSANCVIISGKNGEAMSVAACVVLATTRADVNGTVRKRMGVRKASFAPIEEVVLSSGMEYGGITPIGIPDDWRVYVDQRVIERDRVVIGSGLRRSKLFLPGQAIGRLPNAEIVQDLAKQVS